jgi:alpha-L-fucosidase
MILTALSLFGTMMITPPTQSTPFPPLRPTPTARQLEWHKMGYYAFIHFGINTFYDVEWGHGTEDPTKFNPTQLDARQWVRTFKKAGMKGVIFTAKHHDGMCFWPSKFSTHTIAQTPFRGGKGDLLREISDACKAEGLKLGIYLSPWDRNHPTYGTPEYNQTFVKMLEEVLGNYGPIFEVWFDGANGEGPNGKKQVYDWPLFIKTVRRLQPNAVIFSDAGPDIRWVGNESGHAAPESWATINRRRYFPGTPLSKELTVGTKGGADWVPAECDVSIRPGWFYHAKEDRQVKDSRTLMDLYLKSVGQNGSLLLNVPPDKRGLIHENDVNALMEFRKLREETFRDNLASKASITSTSQWSSDYGANNINQEDHFWAAAKEDKTPAITLSWRAIHEFDHIVLKEPIAAGQRVAKFKVETIASGGWKTLTEGTTIGNTRILKVPRTQTSTLRIVIQDSLATPALSEIGVYDSPRPNTETPEMRDARMKWFRESRFGMFIHWGVYSQAAGEWNGKNVPGAGEWIMNGAKIKPTDYAPLKEQFNPVNFNAKEWVRIAKDAGMKYIVITSKHHDGFAIYPSKLNKWNIGSGPFKRDPLKELADACREAGIRLCFYHSIMDWTHPDYLPRRAWDDRDASKADFDRYVDFMKGQLKELLTNYGPIGIVWFDGEWESTWSIDRGRDLEKFVRSLQPQTIINNRVNIGRAGMAMKEGDQWGGDYGTPEQEIPANGLPGVDWESCMTMNGTWGFHKNDTNWKSSKTLIQNLVDCASKGGNYLLNVGPTGLGEIPPASVERLAEVGKWMKVNGEAVYATQAGPFPRPLPWGRVTQKGNKLFLVRFDGTVQGLRLDGLKGKLTKAYPLGAPGQSLTIMQDRSVNGTSIVAVPTRDPNAMPDVFVVEFEGKLEVEPYVATVENGTAKFRAKDAETKGSAHFEASKDCIGFWTDTESTVNWKLKFPVAGAYTVEAEYACDPASQGSEFSVVIGGSKVVGKVASTGSWSTFTKVNLGTIQVSEGIHQVTVRALSMPNGAVMNLRSLTLVAVVR